MKLFLFSGQGAQKVGLGEALWNTYPLVRSLFERFSDITRVDPKKLLFQSTEQELAKTKNTQLAMTLINLSVYELAKEKNIIPDIVMGHSLGEIHALYAAESISFDDSIKLIHQRGKLFEKLFSQWKEKKIHTSVLAILGLDYRKVIEIAEQFSHKSIYLSHINYATQTCLAGDKAELTKIEPYLKEAGAKRTLFLSIEGAMHCPLLSDISEEWANILSQYHFKIPKKIILSNVSGTVINNQDNIQTILKQHILNPVLWLNMMNNVWNNYPIDEIYESSYGATLSNMWNQFVRTKSQSQLCINLYQKFISD